MDMETGSLQVSVPKHPANTGGRAEHQALATELSSAGAPGLGAGVAMPPPPPRGEARGRGIEGLLAQRAALAKSHEGFDREAERLLQPVMEDLFSRVPIKKLMLTGCTNARSRYDERVEKYGQIEVAEANSLAPMPFSNQQLAEIANEWGDEHCMLSVPDILGHFSTVTGLEVPDLDPDVMDLLWCAESFLAERAEVGRIQVEFSSLGMGLSAQVEALSPPLPCPDCIVALPSLSTTFDISTGHILEKDLDLLRMEGSPFKSLRPYEEGVIIAISQELPVDPREMREFGFSAAMVGVYLQAQHLGCRFINLDRDGATYPELQSFDW
jgi:hypothetical protein